MDLLQIEHPLVLAPMASIGTVELAASVCAAGGLGSIGCAAMQPELVAKTIQALRGLTDKPINVNFFCHVQAKADADREQAWRDRLSPYYCELGIDPELPHPRVEVAPFDDAMCSVVENTKPEVVSHFGLPDSALLARVKAVGCRIMSSATTVADALWLEARGVDTIIAQGYIAQGYEAGGHRGMFLAPNLERASASQPGTLALVPQVVDAVSVPVVTAGGIADGRGIHAVLVGSSRTAGKRNAGRGADAQIGGGSNRAIQAAQRSLGSGLSVCLRDLAGSTEANLERLGCLSIFEPAIHPFPSAASVADGAHRPT
jgi:nitronate monooxygenase